MAENTTHIALAGNPNVGKTVLFNALTGLNQAVGNWPGVTVEKRVGSMKGHDHIQIVDLPGIYSLSPYSPEEVITRNYLVKERPDAVINIIDGTNLERNLYLTTQLVEIGLPMVIAINMADVLKSEGIEIDAKALGEKLGAKVCFISALHGEGIDELMETAVAAAKEGVRTRPQHIFDGAVEHTLAHIEEALLHEEPEEIQRWYSIKVFERDEPAIKDLAIPADKLAHVEKDIVSCERELDDDSVGIITNARYDYAVQLVEACADSRRRARISVSEKIDRIVMNRYAALPIFVVVMFLVYFIAVSTLGTIMVDWVNDVAVEWLKEAVAGALASIGCAAWLEGLIVEGIVGGVGAVIGFVPQIMVLFFMLAILESCGYMARVAFMLDRIFRRFGLSGRSFIPILIGTGCGVPGIMASRGIEENSAREITVITTTFMPCSAKLPIISLIAGSVFGGSGAIATLSYFIGIAAIIISGIILKKFKHFSAGKAPFVMELPAYRLPSLKAVLKSMWDRAWAFIKKAGTIILLSTIVIWFLSNFGFTSGGFGMVDDLEDGLLAAIGKAIAFLFIPLGWGEWIPTVATFTGWVAKENVVSTIAVLLGASEDEEAGLFAAFAAMFTPIAAFSFLLFNQLCAPCFAAMGAIKREMGSAKMTFFAIGWQMLFAYAVAFTFYQVAMLVTTGTFTVATVVGIIVLALMIFLLVRPARKNGEAKAEQVETQPEA